MDPDISTIDLIDKILPEILEWLKLFKGKKIISYNRNYLLQKFAKRKPEFDVKFYYGLHPLENDILFYARNKTLDLEMKVAETEGQVLTSIENFDWLIKS